MRKLLNLFKHNTLFGIIIGIVICSITIVIAESINSDEVLYDNSNSSSNKENVQDALDNLYNIVDTVGSGYALVANNTTGLSTELVAGLYRYQGVQDANNTVDNYICFGTTNKSDCVSDTDKYMYRIIGINELGQMKLIKKEALNTAYAWSSNMGVTWPNSDIFKAINGADFLNNENYVPSGWSDKIVVNDWHYGDVGNMSQTASEIFNIESQFPTISAKIGLMYIHDYYYGVTGNRNCRNESSVCQYGWIHLSRNDSNPPSTVEAFISRVHTSGIWGVKTDGAIGAWTMSSAQFSIFPVFYLYSFEIITSGSGTLTDPYILS